MKTIHWQGGIIAKIEPTVPDIVPRPGRTLEEVPDDDPRVAAFLAEQAAARAAAIAKPSPTAAIRSAPTLAALRVAIADYLEGK